LGEGDFSTRKAKTRRPLAPNCGFMSPIVTDAGTERYCKQYGCEGAAHSHSVLF
jgi:hypothetical protein